MLLFKSLLLISIFILTSCGFQPLYGKQFYNKFSDICITESSFKTNDEILRTQFLSFLDKLFVLKSNDCKYEISGKLEEKFKPFIIQKDGSIERYEIIFNIDYNIKAATWEKNGNLETSGSFQASDQEYINFYAVKDTKVKLAQDLAEELRYKILLTISHYETKH